MKSMSIKALLLTLVIAGSAQAMDNLPDWRKYAPVMFGGYAPAPAAAAPVVAAPAKNQAEYIANLKAEQDAIAAQQAELDKASSSWLQSSETAKRGSAAILELGQFANEQAGKLPVNVQVLNEEDMEISAVQPGRFAALLAGAKALPGYAKDFAVAVPGYVRAAPGKAWAVIKATPGATKAFVVDLPTAVKAGASEALVDTQSLWTNLNVFKAENRDAFLNAFGRDAVKAAKVGLALAAMYYTGKACLFGINAARAKFASTAKEDKASTSSVSASSSASK